MDETMWVVQFNVNTPRTTPCGVVVNPGWRDLGHQIVEGKRVFPARHDIKTARRIAREFANDNPGVDTRIREF